MLDVIYWTMMALALFWAGIAYVASKKTEQTYSIVCVTISSVWLVGSFLTLAIEVAGS